MEFLNRRVTHEICALEQLIFQKFTGTIEVDKRCRHEGHFIIFKLLPNLNQKLQ